MYHLILENVGCIWEVGLLSVDFPGHQTLPQWQPHCLTLVPRPHCQVLLGEITRVQTMPLGGTGVQGLRLGRV